MHPFANHLPTICQPFAKVFPQDLPWPPRLAIAAPGQGQSRQQTHRARTHHGHRDVLREAEARGKINQERRWINHQQWLENGWIHYHEIHTHIIYIYLYIKKQTPVEPRTYEIVGSEKKPWVLHQNPGFWKSMIFWKISKSWKNMIRHRCGC